jgi:transglutaminase-like putative cysteine protease
MKRSPRLRPLLPLLVLLGAWPACARALEGPETTVTQTGEPRAILPPGNSLNLVADPTVDVRSKSWRASLRGNPNARAFWDSLAGRNGGGALYLACSGADTSRDYTHVPTWSCRLDSLPPNRLVRYQVWVRGRGCDSGPVLGVQALGPDNVLLEGASTENVSRLRGTFAWTRLEGVIAVPAGAVRCGLIAFLVGNGEVWFDDFEVREVDSLSAAGGNPAAEAPPTSPDGEHLYLAQVRSVVRVVGPLRAQAPALASPTTRVRIALPLADDRQVPVALTLRTEPRGSLANAELGEDSTGRLVADLDLRSPNALWRNQRIVTVEWDAKVLLLPSRRVTEQPREALPGTWPASVRRWLASSACCESDAPEIQRLAQSLRAGAPDELEFIRRTFIAVARMREGLRPRETRAFDATSAMHEEGSCLSNAFLVAALLRAAGIPARLRSGIPTWAAYTSVHFVVEAFFPSGTWMRLEPTLLQNPAPDSGQVDLVAIEPDDETKGAISRPGAVDCLPFLSVSEFAEPCEHCGFRGGIGPDSIAGRTASILESRALGGSSSDWRGRRAELMSSWRRWVATHPRIGPDGVLATPFHPTRLADLFGSPP